MMLISLLLLGATLVTDVAKVDIDLDGKNEELQLRLWVSPLVSADALNETPLVDAEVLIKDDEKIIKVGQVQRIADIRPMNVWTVVNQETKQPERMILILKADEAYYAIVYPYKMFLIPKELFPCFTQ